MSSNDDIAGWMASSYAELRRLVTAWMRGTAANVSIQPTSLVHEAFVRLAQRDPGSFNDRTHFMAVAATAMRHILVDRRRRRRTRKHGGDFVHVTLEEALVPAGSSPEVDVLEIDQALTALAALSPRQAAVAELRLFAGATMPEVAQALSVSLSTAESEWRLARVWLRREFGSALQRSDEPTPGAPTPPRTPRRE